jgi:drug/metabolite transporter (DMT)-like permease
VAKHHAIWLFAAGYFACYVPYSALTKALSDGSYPGVPHAVPGATLLPATTIVGLVAMVVFLWTSGWWRQATQRQLLGRTWPVPTRWTALSGLCTAVILTTTTLAYTFEGVSIVFVMLLMRGGVLVLAPIVDALTGRRARWFSWIGLSLSMAALVVAFAEDGGSGLTVACAVDVSLYLAAYFVRLRFMSRLAKSPDSAITRRYFVEEHIVATPAALVALVVFALWGQGPFMQAVREGFQALPWGAVLPAVLIGLLSEGTGIFGTLVFLDARENTFSVPVNRCASILAGVVASFVLALWLDAPWPSAYELGGGALVVLAILVLTLEIVVARARRG